MNHLVCFVLFLVFFFSLRARFSLVCAERLFMFILQGGRQNKALRFQISPRLFGGGGNEVGEGKFLQSISRLQ